MAEGVLGMSGRLVARKIGVPKVSIWWKIHNLPHVLAGWRAWVSRYVLRAPTLYSELFVRKHFADGRWLDYGLVSTRVVTTAFVNLMVDQLQTETSVWGDFKYHDSGVGTTNPAVGDTAIETTDGEARATGNQGEGASANIYKSVGTISYTTSKAITEHGIFNTSDSATLLDRSEFDAINVVSGDSIEFTYQLTCTAGG